MKSIHVFSGIDQIQRMGRIQVFGKRQLDQQAVDLRILVQLLNQVLKLRL